MNINKEINKIQKKIAEKVERMVLENIDSIDIMIKEKYEPLLDELRELVELLYSKIKIPHEDFTELMNRLLAISEILRNRNIFVHHVAEMVLIDNRERFGEILAELAKWLNPLPIKNERIIMEIKKAKHNAIKKQTYLLNTYHAEIENEIVSTIEWCSDSFREFVESNRVLDTEEEELLDFLKIDEVVEEQVYFKKTDKTKDIINFVEKCGFTFDRQNRTSHMIFKHKNEQIVVIPNHGSTIDVYLGLAIQKQAWSKSL